MRRHWGSALILVAAPAHENARTALEPPTRDRRSDNDAGRGPRVDLERMRKSEYCSEFVAEGVFKPGEYKLGEEYGAFVAKQVGLLRAHGKDDVNGAILPFHGDPCGQRLQDEEGNGRKMCAQYHYCYCKAGDAFALRYRNHIRGGIVKVFTDGLKCRTKSSLRSKFAKCPEPSSSITTSYAWFNCITMCDAVSEEL